LALGNAPRRCHNCGRYFLLTSSYDICYLLPVRRNAPVGKWGLIADEGLKQKLAEL